MNLTKKLLFIDSQDGTKNYDTNVIDTNIYSPIPYYYHPYNISLSLPSPFTNIKRILLKSVQMPIAMPNVRSTNTSNLFSLAWTVGVTGAAHTTKFPTSIYSTFTDISPRLAAASSAIYNYPLDTRINISFSTQLDDNGFTVCVLTHTASTLTIKDSILMNTILGFRSGLYLYSPIVAAFPLNLFYDTHLYMYIPNIPTNNYSSKQATFKIPLLNGYSTTMKNLYYEDVNEHQAITFNNNNNFILDKLNIIINDKFGCPIKGFYDYSFSLLIEYEENYTQIETLNINY